MWCWAACAVMVTAFRGNPMPQCQAANHFFNVTDCCQYPQHYNVGRSAEQSKNFYLGQGYTNAGLVNWALTFSVVQQLIGRNLPIEATIDWRGSGSAHAVIVHGWAVLQGNQYVYVNDPANGAQVVLYAHLVNGYGYGSWQQSNYGM
nr:hypothetical protein GCM10020063_023790 [Dactylosporangium thailandense]